VDAVGHIIADRERERFPWGAGALLAVLLHGSVAGALVYSAIALLLGLILFEDRDLA